jgi:Cu/Ag efflux protein CusF
MKASYVFWLVVLVSPVILLGCKAGTPKDAHNEYDVRGKVVALDSSKPAVTLDHEDIPGLMKGMQMEFAVADAKLLDGVKAGDRVQGRLRKSESGYILTRLEKRTGQ